MIRVKEAAASIILQGIIPSAENNLRQVIKDQIILWQYLTSREVADIGCKRQLFLTET